MKFSSFGQKLSGDSGILQLMDDLGRPLPSGVTPCMLGGGNPARVTEVEKVYRREMEKLLSRGDAFEEAISRYDAPQGRVMFIDALVHFFVREYGWNIDSENIAVTNGSQSAFFYLFNLFSGTSPKRRTILFPLVPEYIGYADQGIEKDTFVTLPARVVEEGKHSFKYYIDLPLVASYLAAHPEVGAVCVSRPTNPTGNVLTDTEIEALSSLAEKYDIPLMVDNAYGMPFPNIIFPDVIEGSAAPSWNAHTILSMSLSKIGLPALRTGIIIADKPVIKALGALNSIAALTSGSLGQILAEGIVRTGEIRTLADTAVRPFYRKKSVLAQDMIHELFRDRQYRIHRSEGAIFLWLYLSDLSITTKELYGHLKDRGVVIVPGEYFFFGRENGSDEEIAWKNHPHREKCLRLNYSRGETEVREGLRIIAEVSGRYRLNGGTVNA
jgi:valine--pyruvate aminotransferase